MRGPGLGAAIGGRGTCTVVVTRARLGRGGTDPNPKLTGGRTAASAPSGSPSHEAASAVSTCRSCTPYHSVRPLPAEPVVRRPVSSRAGRSSTPTHAGVRARGGGTARSSQPSGGRRPVTTRSRSGPASTAQVRGSGRRTVTRTSRTSSKA
jgi:hypothetical protein